MPEITAAPVALEVAGHPLPAAVPVLMPRGLPWAAAAAAAAMRRLKGTWAVGPLIGSSLPAAAAAVAAAATRLLVKMAQLAERAEERLDKREQMPGMPAADQEEGSHAAPQAEA